MRVVLNESGNRRAFLAASTGVVAATALFSDAGAEESPAKVSQPEVIADGEGTKVWAMGVQVTIKMTAEETGGTYSSNKGSNKEQ